MISFVVPVYNVEKYINKCIKSILDLGLPNFEIIIVDDGSPDQSISKIENYLNLPNVSLFTQKNSGLSIARNSGLNLAKGKYIWFIDSDDTIEYNSFFVDKLLEFIESDFDLIQIQYYLEYESSVNKKIISNHFEGVSTGIDLLNKNLIHIPAQFKIYKKSFLKSNNLTFYPNIFHEDVEFTFKTFALANKCVSIEIPIYNYLQRLNGSIMNNLNERNVESFITVNHSLLCFKEKNKKLLKNVEDKFENIICINTNLSLRILVAKNIFFKSSLVNRLLTPEVLKCYSNSTVLKYKRLYFFLRIIKFLS